MKDLILPVILIVSGAVTFLGAHYYLDADSEVAKVASLDEYVKVETIIRENYSDYDLDVPINSGLPKFKDVFGHDLNRHMDKYSDDYLGSILIPAIDVNDAIYGGEGEYYLHHDYRKYDNPVGEIYLDDRTGSELTGNGSLLNGHAVPDGSKFGTFKRLLDIKEAPHVYVWDDAKKVIVHYEMMFVSLIDGKTSGIIMEFNSPEEQLSYYQDLHDSAIKRWSRPESTDTFLVMNSCAYIIKKGHYVAFAKKVGEYE